MPPSWSDPRVATSSRWRRRPHSGSRAAPPMRWRWASRPRSIATLAAMTRASDTVFLDIIEAEPITTYERLETHGQRSTHQERRPWCPRCGDRRGDRPARARRSVLRRVPLRPGERRSHPARRPGRALGANVSSHRLLAALDAGATSVRLPIKTVRPKVPDSKIGKTIVVDRTLNVLSLYNGFELAKTYPVATAAAGYVTPAGEW